ncbi:polyprenyl synthetase family protein [Enterococcus nangangensis]
MTDTEKVADLILDFLKKTSGTPALAEAMSYSVAAGGKRLRPRLLLATVAAFQKPLTTGVYQVAAALEMVHTYSLIHDDLPAMDNDDLRRGKPTNHQVFGEALGILAGDGLLTGAFELLGKSQNEPTLVVALVSLLAQKAGNPGMVAGQVLDIAGESRTLSLTELQQVHRLKTGALLEFSFMAGGLLAGASEASCRMLEKVGAHFGLAFQIRDDLLDVLGDVATLGKNTQMDATLNKSTYPRLLGVEGAKAALLKEVAAAEELLQTLGTTEHFAPENLLILCQQLKGNL